MNPPVIDARGQSCPLPVVRTVKAISDGAERVTTIVDNAAAVENVSRLARSRGFAIAVRQEADGTYLDLSREGDATPAAMSDELPPLVACECTTAKVTTVVLITSDVLGQGSAELGERLMSAFLHTLLELSPLPAAIVLMNAGVHLALQGTRCLEDLQALAARNVDVLACGTCLGYFQETDRLAVGRISNMYEIAEVLMGAGKVVHV